MLLVLPLSVAAHDLGTRGHTFPIKEPSLLVQIIKKLSTVNWKQKSEQLLASAKHGLHHYAEDGLTPARQTRTRYVDPSITLQHPISAPVKTPDGKSDWKVIYPAGTRVNPLDKVQPVTRMLVFDPRVPSQMAFALAAMHAWPDLIELVSTGGDIAGDSKKIKRPLFYASSAFVERFHLRHTPSLIGIGKGPLRRRLAITVFGPAQATAAQAVKAVRTAWYGLPRPKMSSAFLSTSRPKKEKSGVPTRGGVTAFGDDAKHEGRHP